MALIQAYTDAVCTEFRWLGNGAPVHTIYFGGGTPSLLSPAQISQIMQAAKTHFDVQPNAEITLEANPGTVDQVYWEGLRATGVNRLSLGMQSAQLDELRLFARDHTLEQVAASVQGARQAGFDNLSLDLIYGVPQQTLAGWSASLDYALALQPQHLSAYALTLEPGTELTRLVHTGSLPAPDDDLAADMYDLATQKLTAQGFEQYEISNWALPGKAAHHNIQYWHNLPYLGIGAGAHGYHTGYRTVNVMRPEQYIERLAAQDHTLEYPSTAATHLIDVVDRDQEIFETLMMGLRLLREGVSRQTYVTRFGESIDTRYSKVLRRLMAQNLLREENDTLYLTQEARLLSNRVFEAFIR